jgi:hypothetical protein
VTARPKPNLIETHVRPAWIPESSYDNNVKPVKRSTK